MRTIETVNIKVNSMASPRTAKQESPVVTAEDFKERFTAFLKKKAATDKDSTDSSKTAAEIDEETEEEEVPLQLVNLTDGRIMQELPLEKSEVTLGTEAIEAPHASNSLETDLILANEPKATIDTVDTMRNEEISAAPFWTGSEKEMSSFMDVLAEQGLEFEDLAEEMAIDFQTLTEDTPVVQEILSELLPADDSGVELAVDRAVDPGVDTSDDLSVQPFDHFIGEPEKETPIEPNVLGTSEPDPDLVETPEPVLEQQSDIQASEPTAVATEAIEKESAADAVDDSTNFVPTENISVPTREPFNEQVERPLLTVKQEDFVYELETLVVEETAATGTQERITTAHIKLTPESLGKVELQIEMHGKDLVARLIVEEAETKEWIEQQMVQLKEQLLEQEIHMKDFQVVVHQDNLHDALSDQQENPFFKQKQKETTVRRQQAETKADVGEVAVAAPRKNDPHGQGISIFV